jgi:uncharacterized protein YdhG (YjbR/CyaY superfamily)
MVSSKAKTVNAYLKDLPPERRRVLSRVREVILQNLPDGYVERMNWGMISYEIPLETFPDTHNGQPLNYIALAAQKNHYSLYIMGANQDPAQEARLRQAYAQSGMKLDMGKSCVRFRKLENLPLDVLGELVAGITPKAYIARYLALKDN